MKNEKARVCYKTQALGLSLEQLHFKPNHFPRQYLCSFCWHELPNNSIRFGGIGACPYCYDLAHRPVDSLREYNASYFNNLGVKK